ncbi:MAG: hypothetical protein FJZ98_08170, partial [Chloroflexi bacterium]|nr:hypothetical protein [Chloroflexota bacterium]
MKIGLIGNGGREHALARAMIKDRQCNSLFVYAAHL